MRVFLIPALASCVCATLMGSAQAQDAARVGVMFWHESQNDLEAFEGFKRGLDYAGLSVTIDEVHVHRDEDLLRRTCARWKEEKVALVLSMGTKATQLLAAEITDIPVCFLAVTNPVAAGLIGEDGVSGRNLTGASNMIFAPYLLASFAQAVPSMTRLAVLYDPDNPVSSYEVEGAWRFLHDGARAAHQAARMPASDAGGADAGGERPGARPATSAGDDDRLRALRDRVQLRRYPVRNSQQLASALDMLRSECDTLWLPIDDLLARSQETIAAKLRASGMPVVTSSLSTIATAMFGVTVDYRSLGLQAADLARGILLEGADPARTPARVASWFQTVVNLQAADELGFELPLSAIVNAERIIARRKAIPVKGAGEKGPGAGKGGTSADGAPLPPRPVAEAKDRRE